MSHRWGEPDRREHETVRVCLKCGLTKLTRHEWNEHWNEWWMVDRWVDCASTPACEPVEEFAS